MNLCRDEWEVGQTFVGWVGINCVGMVGERDEVLPM